MPSLLQIASLVHLVFAVLASAHAVLHIRQARGAALWLGFVWLVPWLGPVLYLLIGINRIPRRARRGEATAPRPAWSEGNQIVPLHGGDVAYAEMLDAIEAAKRSVDLGTYIFDRDRAGERFRVALLAAIERGVKVRVLIDAIGARYSRPSMVKRLRRDGIDVARFLPTATPWRWRYSNIRNHRKIMVVDDELAFAGGMNIREGCLLSLEPDGATLDLHFRIRGPLVFELATLFASDWEFSTGERRLPAGEPEAEALGATDARLIASGPDDPDEPIRWLKLAATVRAKKQVRILTPYFVPDEDVLSALCAAAESGIHIQLVMPEINNLALVAAASRACWARLVARGIEIILSPPPFDHTKLMLIDDDHAIVGSANWDERSFRLNFEVDIECHDVELVATLAAIVDSRTREGTRVDAAFIQTWSLRRRLIDGLARLALPYL